MRRKSSRSTSKSTPERPPDTSRKSRRQSKRQRKSLSRSSSEESDEMQVEQSTDVEATPTVPENAAEQPVWKVTSASNPSGEIQKLKFCLTRSLMSPEKEKSSKHRRNKSGGQTDDDTASPSEKLPRKSRHRGSSGDNVEEHDEEHDHQEDKKGKGKSKTKHKSKSEKTPQIQDVEDNSQSEISENVQVTPQSPQASIDTRVDNEPVSAIESETVTDETENPEILQHSENNCEIKMGTVTLCENPLLENQSNTPPPILEKHDNLEKSNLEFEDCKGFEAPCLSRADSHKQQHDKDVTAECEVQVQEVETLTCENVQDEKTELNHTTEELKMDSSVLTENENVQTSILAIDTANVETAERMDSKDQEEIASVEQQESDSSSEAAENASNDQNSPEKDLTENMTKSMDVDDTHSDNESVSQDTTMNSTLIQANTTLEITQSLSPDIKQIEEVNQELQSMKNKAAELLQTPSKVTRKWGNSFVGFEMMKDSLQKIDINVIKELCPNLKFLDEDELKLDVRERKTSHVREKRKVSVDYKLDDIDYKRLDSQTSKNSTEMEEPFETDNSNIIAMNRKISIVDDTASKLRPPPSPAKNEVSEILYITNLVRPFTLKQLKELLERTGKIRENGFWTDRIKSKCYAYYESIEESEGTRNALHGVNWPIGNGKKLIIEYATSEEFEKARNPTPPPAPAEPSVTQPVLEEQKAIEKDVTKEPLKNKEDENKERQRHKSEGHVREWDIGKENVQKSRHRHKDVNDKNDRHKRRRTPSPADDFISRKEKKKEEDIPQKLMDDLFRKTKTTPSIYWLPLTPEEIATKQQQRLLRMAEHKRRMEESTRNRGDYGRGAPYRRRYD